MSIRTYLTKEHIGKQKQYWNGLVNKQCFELYRYLIYCLMNRMGIYFTFSSSSSAFVWSLWKIFQVAKGRICSFIEFLQTSNMYDSILWQFIHDVNMDTREKNCFEVVQSNHEVYRFHHFFIFIEFECVCVSFQYSIGIASHTSWKYNCTKKKGSSKVHFFRPSNWFRYICK